MDDGAEDVREGDVRSPPPRRQGDTREFFRLDVAATAVLPSSVADTKGIVAGVGLTVFPYLQAFLADSAVRRWLDHLGKRPPAVHQLEVLAKTRR
jgi:hypothetical protein